MSENNNKILKLAGNQTIVNPNYAVVPDYLMNSVTESMDNIDGDGGPVISDKNVLMAKTWVDEHEM